MCLSTSVHEIKEQGCNEMEKCLKQKKNKQGYPGLAGPARLQTAYRLLLITIKNSVTSQSSFYQFHRVAGAKTQFGNQILREEL